MPPVKHHTVRPGSRVDLADLPTAVPDLYRSKAGYQTQLAARTAKLQALQNLLYADDRHALLLIFQAMDAAGKDGAIKHVMSGINPQGCQVFSFKAPSAEELDHDFLWRAARALPERGRIGIFNRSYYEEALVVRVHPELLMAQRIPGLERPGKSVWQERFESINAFERHLVRNGTRVVKFFLHLSKEEQRKRLLKRLDDPEKNWKFAAGDLKERERWDDYRAAYDEVLRHTSTAEAPWHVVPADDKKNARLMISDLIIETLETMKLRYPPPPADLEAMRKVLREEENRE